MGKELQPAQTIPSNWKDAFSLRILERGCSYFEDGRVSKLSFDGVSWNARVSGTAQYAVRVSPDLEYLDCTCPYFQDRGPCKHIAAACYEIEGRESPTPEPLRATQKKPDVDSLVYALSDDERTALLLEALHNDTHMAQALLRRHAPIERTNLQRTFLEDIRDIVRENSHRGFVDYRNAYRCEEELGDYVLDFLEPLFSRGAYRDAFDLTTVFMTYLRRIAIDDSDGFFSAMVGLCHECWSRIFQAADLDLRKTMYAWMASFIEDESPSDDEAGIQWFLREGTEHFLSRTFSQDARFAPAVMAFADEVIADESLSRTSAFGGASRSYVSTRAILWAKAKMQCMKTLDYDEKAIDECLATLPPSWGIIEPIAEQAFANDDAERCVALIETLRGRLANERLPIAASTLLIDAYRRIGHVCDARNELFDLIASGRPEGRKQFESWLRDFEILCGDSWNEQRQRVLDALQPDKRKLCFYYAYISDYENLMDAVEPQGRFALEPYENVLATRYPGRCLAIYEADVRRILKESSPGRRIYWRAIEIMNRMPLFAGGKEAALRLAEDLRKTYPRRPALIEELDRFERHMQR